MLSPIAMRHYLSVMQAKGVSSRALLADLGIDHSVLMNPNFSAEPRQYRVFVSNILETNVCGGIGFDMGQSLTVQDMGALGYAVMTCRSVRETVNLWNRYGKTLVGNLPELEIVLDEKDSDVVVIEYRGRDYLDPVFIFQIEEALGMLGMEMSLTGEAPAVRQVSLAYPAPRHEGRYHELFGSSVRFGAASNHIVIDKSWLSKSVRTYDDGFNRVCLDYCENALRRMGGSQLVTQRLQEYLLSQSGALPGLAESADALNLSVRTLRRRLADEGTTFRNVIEAWRIERAQECLKHFGMSPKEVAYLLGFNEASAFRHAFKKWTGRTISEYRSSLSLSESAAGSRH